MIALLKSKLHRATVTEADIDYVGSLTLDPELMEAAGILHLEMVDVYDVTNGARLTTYAISGRRGSGEVKINGAAARLVQPGDKVIVVAWRWVNEGEVSGHRAKIVILGEGNKILEVREESPTLN